jgi:hypothetical protein
MKGILMYCILVYIFQAYKLFFLPILYTYIFNDMRDRFFTTMQAFEEWKCICNKYTSR